MSRRVAAKGPNDTRWREVAAYDAFDFIAQHKRMLMQTNAEQVFRLA